METQKRTNKELVAKGVKILVLSLSAITLGPVLVYNAFMNKEHPLFLAVLSVGILLLFVAIFLILKGINTILKSLFN